MSISFSEDAQQEVVTSSRVLPEDSGEGSLRPRLLKDYTGQEKAKENLQVCIDEARLRGEPLNHVLLYGPPGLGKTTMAAVIANAPSTIERSGLSVGVAPMTAESFSLSFSKRKSNRPPSSNVMIRSQYSSARCAAQASRRRHFSSVTLIFPHPFRQGSSRARR